MDKVYQTAVFEGGVLRVMASGVKSREAALALPLGRLLVRLVCVAEGEDPVEVARGMLSAASPFPDESLAVGLEKVCDEAGGRAVYLAAALPEGSADDIADALDAAKLNVVRVDALVLGELRGVWRAIGGEGRRLVVFEGPDGVSLVVLDADLPVSIRAASPGSDLRREAMLSLLEAEDFGGPKPLGEVVRVRREAEDSAADSAAEPPAEPAPDPLASFGAPVRSIELGADAGLAGIAERTAEDGSLNAMPDSWRAVLAETRFKAKLVRNMIAAVAVWLVAMAVIFGVPVAYGYMTDYQKNLCKRHAKQYKAVADKKAKVKLVRKYSDHSRGALEIMKAVSDRLPAGVTLSSWDFTRDDGVRLRAESDDSSSAYQLKDALAEMCAEGEDAEDGEGEKIFEVVRLGALSKQKDGKQKFEIECSHRTEEE
ncbi:MAG: hypothetical protein IKC15_03880 [Kiritimatiellae bacterium]|nr:hypothetical protein [Kiritimatiellia bacterium]